MDRPPESKSDSLERFGRPRVPDYQPRPNRLQNQKNSAGVDSICFVRKPYRTSARTTKPAALRMVDSCAAWVGEAAPSGA